MTGAIAAVLATVCVVLLSSLLVTVAGFLGADIDPLAGDAERVIPAPVFLVAVCISDTCLLLVAILVICMIPGNVPFLMKTGDLWKTACGVAGVFLINFTGTRIMRLIGEPRQETPDLTDSTLMPLILVTAVIIAPAVEELFFREAVFSRLMGRYPAAGSVVSSIAFGMLHFGAGGVALVITMATMGGVLAWLRHSTGSLAAPFAAHAINNLGALLLLGGGL